MTRRGVFVRALPVAAILLMPVFVHAGFFDVIIGFVAEAREEEAPQEPVAYNAETVPLLKAATHGDPNPSKGGGDIFVDEDGALVPSSGGVDVSGDSVSSNGEIIIYTVRPEDTLSQIGSMFGVSVNTILWANDITKATAIRPGDELLILPISGVRHIVKSGDSLKSIAKKYHADAAAEDLAEIMSDIASYNQLAESGALAVGTTVIIPGGEMMAPPKPAGGKAGSISSGTAAAPGYFGNPVPGARKTQGIHGYNGVDLGARTGTPVYAAAAGSVIVSKAFGWNGGYGQYIVVKHANGTQTLYAHLSGNVVAAGTSVAKGELIGYVGNTGRSTGSHLHFEVRGAKNPF